MSIYVRLFWGKAALISFLISLLYPLAQYFFIQKNLIKSMTTDEISFMVTVSLLIYVLTTILLNILSEVDNLLHPDTGTISKRLEAWRKNDVTQIPYILDERFAQTIEKFANTHEGFINGIYNNYPHNFTAVFDKNNKNFKELNHKSTKSLYLWRDNVGVDTYLELANELLKMTKSSVYATTYYDNSQFIKAMATNNKVKVWLESVNAKNKIIVEGKEKNNPNFTLFRVHIFEREMEGESTSKCFNDFIGKMNNNKKALKNYKEKQVSPCDYHYTWFVEGEVRFYGEYIIFDEQIMLKYNEDFCILEVYIGNIVKEHAKNFKYDAIYFELDKYKMISILDEIS